MISGLTHALGPFALKSFRFQWPADLLTSWAGEMEGIILSWYVIVETGSVLVLTTDGLLEDDGTDPGCNERALLSVLGDGLGDEPERLADRLLASPRRLTRHGDDIALMVARVDGPARSYLRPLAAS